MQIKLNVASIYKVGNVQLVPGLNEVVENDELKKFLANPLVKLDIDMGMIKVVEKPVEKTIKAK